MSNIIIGIVGDLCSGKHTVCEYFEKYYDFTIINNDIINNSYPDKIDEIKIKLDSLSIYKTELKQNLKYVNKPRMIFVLNTISEYEELSNKSTFRLINILAPVKIRYSNFKIKYKDDFEKFIELDYKSSNDLKILQNKAIIHINNNTNLDHLHTKLSSVFTFIEKYLRPSWDDYFMKVAHIVASRSNCIKQRVGAIIVKNNRILSTGYNGTPSGLNNCYDGECPRCNENFKQGEALDQCYCIHAEENALLEIGRIVSKGAILYSTVYPCLMCSKLLIQCGINEVIYDKDYNSEHTDIILNKSGIKVTKWIPQNPIII